MQGLKVFDTSVESITTGTWQALGSAWRSGSLIVQKYSPLLISIFSFCFDSLSCLVSGFSVLHVYPELLNLQCMKQWKHL